MQQADRPADSGSQINGIDPVFFGLGTAVLFGCGAPLAKIGLATISPIILAGLLYLGSASGLAGYLAIRSLIKNDRPERESSLKREDFIWLAGVIICGGFLAPFVLMASLDQIPAATATLLLNFEVVSTTLLAALAFHEFVGRRVWIALACITTACILLTCRPGVPLSLSLPAIGILMACTFWALDNNFSRNIALRDPVIIVVVKGFCGGLISLCAGMLLGEPLPAPGPAGSALILGFISYGGLASVLFLLALRGLGSARSGALLSISPLFGGALSFLLFSEPLPTFFMVAVPIMAAGIILLLTEDHRHLHVHEPLVHEHRHRHDDLHHHHSHDDELMPEDHNQEHSHLHTHPGIIHDHPHKPDIHHRHRH
jgi:drug/metabolite transporter (DMT)-like permease